MGCGIFRAFALALATSGCCFFPAPDGDSDDADDTTEATTEAFTIDEVVFARGVSEQFELEGGPVTQFRANETVVHARVTIDGRPSSGHITMRWMWHEQQIAEASVDLSDVNGGLLFSVGQNTYVRGTLTLERLLYIGDGYHLVIVADGEELGNWSFEVLPPEGARPSRFISAQLYRSFDPQTGPSDPTTTFAPTETVYIVGQVALGHLSWFDADFTVNQQIDRSRSSGLIGQEGGGDPMNFVLRGEPGDGWPVGNHRATLTLNDNPAMSLPFTVAAN